MKIKLLLLFALLTSMFTRAQTNDSIATLKLVCSQSEVIFEGKVLSIGNAFKASNGVIYTPCEVVVTSIIFGTPTASSIQILIQGGFIIENGMGEGESISHSLGLANGNSIIFCNKAKIVDLPNSYLLTQQVCFLDNNQIVKKQYLSQYYSDVNMLLKDLSSVLNVKIPQKKSPEINEKENKEELSIDTILYLEKVKNYNDFITQSELKKKKAGPASAYRATSNALTISTGNEQITFDGTSKYFEFDVFVKTEVPFSGAEKS